VFLKIPPYQIQILFSRTHEHTNTPVFSRNFFIGPYPPQLLRRASLLKTKESYYSGHVQEMLDAMTEVRDALTAVTEMEEKLKESVSKK
jgi:hypothetical protein